MLRRATLSVEVELPLFLVAPSLSLTQSSARSPFPMLCLLAFVRAYVRACVRACRFPLFTQCLLDRVCVCLSISLFARHSSFLRFFLHWLVAFLRGERELAGRATASSKVTSNELILARGSLEKFYVPSRAPLLSQFHNSCPLVPAR